MDSLFEIVILSTSNKRHTWPRKIKQLLIYTFELVVKYKPPYKARSIWHFENNAYIDIDKYR